MKPHEAKSSGAEKESRRNLLRKVRKATIGEAPPNWESPRDCDDTGSSEGP